MIGDRITGVHIEWREHQYQETRTRRCIGTVEHIGKGTVLIRRPRGGLVLKRLLRDTVQEGRLAVRHTPEGDNVLLIWMRDDAAALTALTRRRAAAASHRVEKLAAWREAQATEQAAAEASGEPWCPY